MSAASASRTGAAARSTASAGEAPRPAIDAGQRATAMILAAGRGDRMRPLTDTTPKPLLAVHGRPLIEWHLDALAEAGVRRVVINTAWLEEQIVERLGDGTRWGLSIHYSLEGRDHGGALETAGGIATAQPWLADAFWVVSADIYAPAFRFDPAELTAFAAGENLAKVWVVSNPPFHAKGDFGIDSNGMGIADAPAGQSWTYANLALCKRALCSHIEPGRKAALGPLLHAGMRAHRIAAAIHDGPWENVGTPAQLEALNAKPR